MEIYGLKNFLGMLWNAPGRLLHRASIALRKNTNLMRGVLLALVLTVLTALLFAIRGNFWILLILGVILAVDCFYLYFRILGYMPEFLRKLEKKTEQSEKQFRAHSAAFFGNVAGKTNRGAKPSGTGYTAGKKAGTTGAGYTAGKKAGTSGAGNTAGKKAGTTGAAQAGKGAKTGGARKKSGEAKSENTSGGQSFRGSSSRKQSSSNSRKNSSTSGRNSNATGKNSSTSGQRHRAPQGATLSPLDEAKQIFSVEMPYTLNEIKQKRNMLLKKYHPDNPEGSEEMSKKVNECYEILLKYVS